VGRVPGSRLPRRTAAFPNWWRDGIDRVDELPVALVLVAAEELALHRIVAR
jgi:hypothetical protein